MFYILSGLHLERLMRPDYDALQVPLRHTEACRSSRGASSRRPMPAGVRVDVWTMNEAAEMRRLLDLGADVIMTDRPETLAGVLAERGQPHAAMRSTMEARPKSV